MRSKKLFKPDHLSFFAHLDVTSSPVASVHNLSIQFAFKLVLSNQISTITVFSFFHVTDLTHIRRVPDQTADCNIATALKPLIYS
jgi:hypothetical protein